MSIAIIGKNTINGLLEERLNKKGLDAILLDDIDCIGKIDGEAGNFTITTIENNQLNSLSATHIIITEKPSAVPFPGVDDFMPVLSLSELAGQCRDEDNRNTGKDSLERYSGNKLPVVFLLDYPGESEAYNTCYALTRAIELVRRKREVFFLFKFMRTAGSAGKSLEGLYSEVRNSGVTFIRYDDVSVKYDTGRDAFKVEVLHEIGAAFIEAGLLVWASPLVPGEKLDKVFRLLRLKLDDEGFPNGERYFLYPALTSRRGVYFINTKALPGGDWELDGCVNFTIASISDDMAELENGMEDFAAAARDGFEPGYGLYYAQVDGEKCAFCYTCYRVCTHQAMYPDDENSMMKCLKNACYGCGICVSVCPANAVRLVKANVEKAGRQDGADESAGENTGECIGVSIDERTGGRDTAGGSARKKALKIICCENSGEIAVRKLLKHFRSIEDITGEIEVEPVSCGGRINPGMLISQLEDFENVLVLTCIDKACKHFEGNKRAKLHVARARKLLHDLGIDEEKIGYAQLSHAMPHAAEEQINTLIGSRLAK